MFLHHQLRPLTLATLCNVQELYSGGNDLSIAVWSPLRIQQPEEAQGLSEQPAEADEDVWSDDAF